MMAVKKILMLVLVLVMMLLMVESSTRDELIARRRLSRQRHSLDATQKTESNIGDREGVSRVQQERRSRGRLLSRNRYQETNDDTEHNGDNDEGLINTKSDDERDKPRRLNTRQRSSSLSSRRKGTHRDRIIIRIPKDDSESKNEEVEKVAIVEQLSKSEKQSSPRNSIHVNQKKLEPTTPMQVATTTTSTITTTPLPTTLDTSVSEQDSGVEAATEVNNKDNLINNTNQPVSNNRIKVQNKRPKSIAKPALGRFTPRRRGGARFNKIEEKVTEKQPEDFSQTASNLFLSTFMGVQRTEAPIISSTTSKMFIVTMTEESIEQHSSKGSIRIKSKGKSNFSPHRFRPGTQKPEETTEKVEIIEESRNKSDVAGNFVEKTKLSLLSRTLFKDEAERKKENLPGIFVQEKKSTPDTAILVETSTSRKPPIFLPKSPQSRPRLAGLPFGFKPAAPKVQKTKESFDISKFSRKGNRKFAPPKLRLKNQIIEESKQETTEIPTTQPMEETETTFTTLKVTTSTTTQQTSSPTTMTTTTSQPSTTYSNFVTNQEDIKSSSSTRRRKPVTSTSVSTDSEILTENLVTDATTVEQVSSTKNYPTTTTTTTASTTTSTTTASTTKSPTTSTSSPSSANEVSQETTIKSTRRTSLRGRLRGRGDNAPSAAKKTEDNLSVEEHAPQRTRSRFRGRVRPRTSNSGESHRRKQTTRTKPAKSTEEKKSSQETENNTIKKTNQRNLRVRVRGNQRVKSNRVNNNDVPLTIDSAPQEQPRSLASSRGSRRKLGYSNEDNEVDTDDINNLKNIKKMATKRVTGRRVSKPSRINNLSNEESFETEVTTYESIQTTSTTETNNAFGSKTQTDNSITTEKEASNEVTERVSLRQRVRPHVKSDGRGRGRSFQRSSSSRNSHETLEENKVANNRNLRLRSRSQLRQKSKVEPTIDAKNTDDRLNERKKETKRIQSRTRGRGRGRFINEEKSTTTSTSTTSTLVTTISTTTLPSTSQEALISTTINTMDDEILVKDERLQGAAVDINTEYHFFPAESNESKENFRIHQENQLNVEIGTETQLETEDLNEIDLSEQMTSALNLATVTWTQDPYREDEVSETGQPSFDIDFTKNPNIQSV